MGFFNILDTRLNVASFYALDFIACARLSAQRRMCVYFFFRHKSDSDIQGERVCYAGGKEGGELTIPE